MKTAIIVVSCLNIMFLVMHEFDAFHRGEWKMFRFPEKISESLKYGVFLYLHIPLLVLSFYFLWTVFSFSNLSIWIAVNLFSIFHFILHLYALRWKTNVFEDISSFIFICGWAVTGMINLLFFKYYSI